MNFKIHSNYTLTEGDKHLFERQENKCYICSCDLIPDTDDIIKTQCNHIFHYDCLFYTLCANSINPNKKRNIYKIRSCPYCRTFIESPLPIFKPELYKATRHVNIPTNIIRCQAILKSGKRKGLKCNCCIKDNNNLFCGKHKNCNKYENETEGNFICL